MAPMHGKILFCSDPVQVTLFLFFLYFCVANTSHSLVWLENKLDDDSFWDNIICTAFSLLWWMCHKYM